MFIKATDPFAKDYRVHLDGRVARYAMAANEEEGWIEVLDNHFIGMIAPMDSESQVGEGLPEPVELKTKKLYGKVKIERIYQTSKNRQE